jgi:2,4-dienoyl-CoA reductase (NADPH2)
MMATNQDVANHKPVTDAVHEHGGAIAMQILHTGRSKMQARVILIFLSDLVDTRIISIQ